MNNDLIYSLVDMVREEPPWYDFLLVVMPALITILGAIIGIVRKFAQKFNLINENEYILIDKIHDESFIEYAKKWIRWAYEAFIIVLNGFILLGIMLIFLAFANIARGDSNVDTPTIVLMIIAVMLFYLGFVRNVKYNALWELIKRIIDIFCAGSLILMVDSFLIYKEQIIMLLIVITYIVVATAMLIVFSRLGLYKDSKCFCTKLSIVARYAVLIGYSAYWLLQLKTNMITNNVFFFAWEIWCLIEGVFIRMTDDTNIIVVTLHTENGEERTKDKIIQHKNHKIEYQALDGRRKIVDDDRIKKITYQVSDWFRKNSRKTYCIECVKRDGTSLYYQSYRIIKGEWYVFSKIEDGVSEVVYTKIRDVESVTKERV